MIAQHMDVTVQCPAAQSTATKLLMPAGTFKRIHVHQQIIRDNVKKNKDDPAITVRWRNKSYKARDVLISGPSVVMQRMTEPLSCGARIWIETSAEVEIL